MPPWLAGDKIEKEQAIRKNAKGMLKWPTKGYGWPLRVVGF